MEFSQLEFFVTVVAEGSFSKAAERVFRTQPQSASPSAGWKKRLAPHFLSAHK
jgi:hypothetical protein